MARLGKPVEVPQFEGSYMEQFNQEDKWFEKFREENDVIKFPIADGYAWYLVNPGRTWLFHIPIGDAYRIPAAHVRGLRREDVEFHLTRQKVLDELFGG